MNILTFINRVVNTEKATNARQKSSKPEGHRRTFGAANFNKSVDNGKGGVIYSYKSHENTKGEHI